MLKTRTTATKRFIEANLTLYPKPAPHCINAGKKRKGIFDHSPFSRRRFFLQGHHQLIRKFWIVTATAAGLIAIDGADHDAIPCRRHPLGSARGSPAAMTHGKSLCHVIRNCHQLWNRFERNPAKIGIQSSNDYPLAKVGQFVANLYDPMVEELNFVDAYDLDPIIKQVQDFGT